ncbi:MAG: hypothetical protein M3268_05280 [Acidobacteriota bacterium]|nr:hypothetical protein [Acidobacteriota bacterium]
MRWKLLVITSLAAAVVGAGLCITLASFVFQTFLHPGPPLWLPAAMLVLPLASITYAAVFVYRHTARRRKLQAALTALISLVLTSAALFAWGVIP